MDKFTLLQINTNLDLSSLKFEGQDGGSNPIFLAILAVLLLAVLSVAGYLGWTRRVRMLERAALREEAQLRLRPQQKLILERILLVVLLLTL